MKFERIAGMFKIEVKLKVAEREVSVEKFAAMFLAEAIKAAQAEITPPIRVVASQPVKPDVSKERKETSRVLRVKEAAHLLGLRPSTIRAYIANRKIACVRIGRRVFVPREAIEETIMKGLIPAKIR
ncbi:MAG: helix-turn-helix domain-containing protein [Acidobacteria bacterium]|nr:helix-turn-helix domain-containing protein [Acidobacteriota bacterium]